MPRSYERARQFFEKGAELGHAAAANNLGWLFQHGYGVEKDPGQAARYYQEASDKGFAGAQCNLGCLYYEGIGLDRDYMLALDYFKMAAAANNLNGMFNLALLHLNPDAGHLDRNKAISLLRRCSMEGHAEANRLLLTITPR